MEEDFTIVVERRLKSRVKKKTRVYSKLREKRLRVDRILKVGIVK